MLKGEPRLVRFENVGLRYGMGAEILRDISFDIAPRTFQFLTGPSGAGKTTLLRLILLSLPPTRGLITLFGQDRRRSTRPPSRSCGARSAWCSRIFGCSTISPPIRTSPCPCGCRSATEASYRAEVTELLSWVGLGERMHVYPPVLSGGEKQRAAIARALIMRPELLLADEPTGNVDPSLARRLMRLFSELHKSGTSVVIATHDLALMDQFDGARRLVLGDGRLHIYE